MMPEFDKLAETYDQGMNQALLSESENKFLQSVVLLSFRTA
jgi:hypothetical protein